MYENYWGLNTRPFDNRCRCADYYPAETHQSAFLQMRYGLENRRQAVLLAGEAGMGKSLLCRRIQQSLGQDLTPVVVVKHAQLPAGQMADSIARDLVCELDGDLPSDLDSDLYSDLHRASQGDAGLDSSLRVIEQALAANTESGRRALIIVEDAHLLRHDPAWQLLRSLLNLNDYDADLTMMLVGQTEILPTLARRRDFEQRLDVKCMLRAFSTEETMGYVSHRLLAAGASREIFEGTAIERLQSLSCGVPRRINRLADLALVVGFAEEAVSIDSSLVEAASRQLLLPNAA